MWLLGLLACQVVSSRTTAARTGAAFVPKTENATVSVSPSTVRAGEWVTVEFTVSAKELAVNTSEYICRQDVYCETVHHMSVWVGLFLRGSHRPQRIGPQADPYGTPPWLFPSPVKWKPINATRGSVTFQLFATRMPEMEAILYGNGTAWPVELAVSAPIVFADAQEPRHLHVARTQNHTMMRIMWEMAAVHEDAAVRWGVSPDFLSTSTLSGLARTYTQEDVCGPPANSFGWSPVPYFYSAVIGPFPPGHRTIYYQVGTATAGWTDVTSFAAPQAPSRLERLTVAVLADVGEASLDGAQYHWMEPFAINTTSFILADWGTPGHAPLALNPHGSILGNSGKTGPPKGTTLRALGAAADLPTLTGPADLILHLGDLSYATGYESEWDFFMGMIEPIAKRAPYMTMMGNHERDTRGSGNSIGGDDSGGECGIPTQHRFKMPTPGLKQDKGWYSFEQVSATASHWRTLPPAIIPNWIA